MGLFFEGWTMAKNVRGVTLIELLIALVILGVIASIALPTWSTQTQKIQRADAREGLIKTQLAQEKFRIKNGRYANSMSDLGLSDLDSSSRNYYRISIVSGGNTAFLATATPNANGGQRNDACGTFALNQSGPEISGSYAHDAKCW